MNENGNDRGNTLAGVIEAQIACTESLLGVLDRERNALVSNDVNRLEEACEAKAFASQRLQWLAERLNTLTGLGQVPKQLEAFLERQDGGRALLARWQELTRLAQLCSDANRANGALLEVRETQVRGALAALRSEVPATYGRRGANPVIGQNRILSRA